MHRTLLAIKIAKAIFRNEINGEFISNSLTFYIEKYVTF
jgi:hypothetical protein